ncbi:MAG: hypothetical protein ACI8V2_001131 [Candidatus Latescibacterota bacterium]|jgi:hypothetical protein
MLWWQLFGSIFFLTLRLDAVSVPNSGFERVGQAEQLVNWTPLDDATQVVADQSIKHQGKMSGQVHISVPHQVMGMFSEAMPIVPEAIYDVRAFVKFDAVSARRAFLRVHWFDADMKSMHWAVGTSSWALGGDWAQIAGTVVAPMGAQFVRILCLAEDWGGDFEPFDVWFDEVSCAELSGLPPAKIVISAQPVSDKRQTRVQIAVQDSLGAPVKDGTVVVLGSDMGETPGWMTSKRGIAEFVLEVGDAPVGGGTVWARSGNVYGQSVVADVLSSRIVGRIFDAETQRDRSAFVVVQDSLGQAILRRVFNGAFEVFVPPGTWWLTAQTGPTHIAPELQVVEAVSGDSAVVQLPLRPWVDLQAQGWLAGDMNVRGAGGKLEQSVAVADVVLSARGAGLDWALFTDFWDTTLRQYRPQDLALWHTDFYGLWGRLYETPWGDAWTLGDSAQDAEDLFGAQELAHKARGLVGHTRLFTPKRHASQVVFDVLSGPTFDCIDVMSEQPDDVSAQKLWFDLLNQGYRIAATASTQAVLDDVSGTLPGKFRTYVHLDGDATPGRLAQALSLGHSFISSGPLLLFSVFAAGPGSDLPVGRKRRATIKAWARGDVADYLTRIELIRNGEVVQAWDLDGQPRTHKLALTLQDSVDCWYVSKCYGADPSQVALTNPIYFRSSGFESPEPVQAVVRGKIQTTDGKPVAEAQVFVKNPLGDVILETTARNGQFRLWAPPTSVIEVQMKGHGLVRQRIFDNPHIVGMLNEMKLVSFPTDSLFTTTTVERITQSLQNIEMLFVLNDE